MLKNTSGITYWVQEGEGIPLVLLHGLCETHQIWLDFIAKWGNRKIICLDLPGFGASEIYGNGSLRAMAEALHKILQKEQVSKSILIGHSFGGYVALEYAKKFEAKLSGLGLFHSHPYEDSAERKDARRKTIAHIDNYGISTYVKQLFESLPSPDFKAKHPEKVAELIENGLKNKASGVASALEAIRTRKRNDEILRDITCPVLFIVGEKDEIISKNNSFAQLALPDTAAIHILPNVGHLGMIEDRDKTQQIVEQFVSLCETFYE